jgi:predicted RNase H-like nuclease
MGYFVGIDGCRGGWIAVKLSNSGDWNLQVFDNISTFYDIHSDATLILIDIPIGLRERSPEGRHCDLEARARLGQPRRNSVFPVPCRPALYAKNNKEAKRINKELTGRNLSVFTLAIMPKIREVDEFLFKNHTARNIIREVHPEICFWALAGMPMKYKKSKSEGIKERQLVLEKFFPHVKKILIYASNTYPKKLLKKDDVLDALAAGLTAFHGYGRLQTIPDLPERDERDLPMEIVYIKGSTIVKS